MSKARILIIDDNADVRAELKERIESLGHESDEATSQEQALTKVRELHYDGVLLDLAIPVKLEGIARIDHGKNLLQRIVALPDAPPVIVITSNGLDGHKLAVEMMEIGAVSFVAKPFDTDPLEPKIQRILDGTKAKPAAESAALLPFNGGALVLNEDGIELCGALVGGMRGNAIIRGVVPRLATKRNEKYEKKAAKDLAEAISSSLTPASLISAVNEFRDQCTERMREKGVACGKNDVIRTGKGGGYQFCEWIDVRLGKEEPAVLQADADCELVMRVFNRHKKRTVKQVRDAVEIHAVRARAAITALESRGQIKNIGGSGSTTTYSVASAE